MTKAKTALITGVTGQDGAYLARLLLDDPGRDQPADFIRATSPAVLREQADTWMYPTSAHHCRKPLRRRGRPHMDLQRSRIGTATLVQGPSTPSRQSQRARILKLIDLRVRVG